MKKFLDRYDTVIFDMDGVITSEQNYWNSAALTVWEYIKWNRGESIDTRYATERAAEIRKQVFCGDELITVLKGKGVNSNWDLGYVTVLLAWTAWGRDRGGDFSDVLALAKKLSDNIIDEYDPLARRAAERTGFDIGWLRRNGTMWNTMREIFQEWFLGDELNGRPAEHGYKSGLISREEPIIPMDKLKALMKELGAEKRVCTGTGRPAVEMMRPLKDWGIIDFFAPDGLSNYDHVAAAERDLGATLTKPHPYMFLKAMLGTDYDDERIISGDYDKSLAAKTLVIGDAGADILAAKAMKADFCAVLTGVSGAAARGYFEEQGAEYILDSAAELLDS